MTTTTSKPEASHDVAGEKDKWLRAYRQMVRIRLFEEQVNELYTRALDAGVSTSLQRRRSGRGRHL